MEVFNMTLKEQLTERGITELVAYSRKSRGDVEDLTNHRDALNDFAKELGLITIYEEIGSSEDREHPVLKKIIEKVDNYVIRSLCVLRLDRLSRKTTDLERLLQRFQFHDLTLIEVNSNSIINYDDKITHKLGSIMSDLYLEQSKLMLNSGKIPGVKIYGRQQGGGIPLGYVYNRETGKLDIDPKTAPIIKLIFHRYISGYSTRDIALYLNRQGYRTSNGKEFRIKAIIDILKNEKYTGTQVFGKNKWWKKERECVALLVKRL
jgi:site-specific DNA recombinase